MLAGSARISAIDTQGSHLYDDPQLWRPVELPGRHPPLDPGLGEGCEFCWCSTTAHFSENETFLIHRLFAHTQREVLAKNFRVPEAAFRQHSGRRCHRHERYIFNGEVPGPLARTPCTHRPARCP